MARNDFDVPRTFDESSLLRPLAFRGNDPVANPVKASKRRTQLPRILIANGGHTQWSKDIRVGEYAMVRSPSRAVGVGPRFHASILATRQTALRTRTHCSRDNAVEIYHNPANPNYQRLKSHARRGSGTLCYEGPELLLYLHEFGELATILMASVKAREVERKVCRITSDRWVLRFEVSKLLHRVSVPWHVPKVVNTDLQWGSVNYDRKVVDDFKVMEPAVDPATEVVEKINDEVKTAARRLTPEGKRKFMQVLFDCEGSEFETFMDLDVKPQSDPFSDSQRLFQ
jgi:hypothetical protein